jgi:hypothetical protein
MISRRSLLTSLAAGPLAIPRGVVSAADWTPLFDGRSIAGWRASENPASFRARDGVLTASGPRAHLFYDGPVQDANFRNFEFECEALARPGANSGVFFHTAFQEKSWPEQGFEVQICNTHTGEGGYRERKKTGSLYGVRNVYKAFADDDKWFSIRIAVRGKQVEVRVNGMMLVDYVEPTPPIQAPRTPGRVLGSGTFALQCHDSGSTVSFRNIRVRPLPDDARATGEPPVVDDVYRDILRMSAENVPVVDYHVHLKGGWGVEDALRESRRLGIQYGLAVNCGKGFPVETDAGARDFIASLQSKPVFVAMQAEGREWAGMFSPAIVAQFDYVFTDAMTWTDDRGKRMRLWIPGEVGTIEDRQAFMETLVDRTLGILHREPVDIWANPSFLPDSIAAAYDELWTRERMEKVVAALAKNDIAMEVNNRYRIPSAAFIKLARSAGVKFAFGTNNSDANIGRCEYGIAMAKECGLRWQDFFVPKSDGEKPIQRRGFRS